MQPSTPSRAAQPTLLPSHKIIVISLVSQFVKCGFAGDNFPAHIFPSIVGRPILRAEERAQGVAIKVAH